MNAIRTMIKKKKKSATKRLSQINPRTTINTLVLIPYSVDLLGVLGVLSVLAGVAELSFGVDFSPEMGLAGFDSLLESVL